MYMYTYNYVHSITLLRICMHKYINKTKSLSCLSHYLTLFLHTLMSQVNYSQLSGGTCFSLGVNAESLRSRELYSTEREPEAEGEPPTPLSGPGDEGRLAQVSAKWSVYFLGFRWDY